jgi:GT2 family glycosyltransferase
MPDTTRNLANHGYRPDLADYGAAQRDLEPDFNEEAYLRAFPDVARALARGDLDSAWQHYRSAGEAEQRLIRPEYLREMARQKVVTPPPTPASPEAFGIDAVIISESGAIFLVGWANDRYNPLIAISIGAENLAANRDWTQFARLRRPDVESALQTSNPYHFGFWIFDQPGDNAQWRRARAGTACRIELRFANGATAETNVMPVTREDWELRDEVMTYLGSCQYLGNRTVEAFGHFDKSFGSMLVAFNRAISRSIVAAAATQRFGPRKSRYAGSIVVPLFGVAEYLFLQANAFAGGPGIEDYEFIYVVNSPELIERLQREARIAEMVYGLAQTLVMLPGNAGFGAANNVAAQFAQSDRLVCLNPDVFPYDPDWARRHTDLLANLPAAQTRLFGTTLYYNDGSLMHGGMYFDRDVGVQINQGGITQRPILRVEHYGKGAPFQATQFTRPRPVPAVTGAFISVDRSWFENLGGFTEDYVFGHYEDADLCLKSLQAGTPSWLHDIRMWHLEGKGSHRLPQHEGGSMINRWLFSRTWEPVIVPDLLGRTPRHKLLANEPASGPVAKATSAPRDARARTSKKR